jgi:hypothetical protein
MAQREERTTYTEGHFAWLKQTILVAVQAQCAARMAGSS